MGNILSNKLKELLGTTNVNETASISTPKSTNYRLLYTDPRSPSGNVDRTPIQVETTPRINNSENIYHNIDLSGRRGNDDSDTNNKPRKVFRIESNDRLPQTMYGSSIGSPITYLRHKQVEHLKSELHKRQGNSDESSIEYDLF